MAMTFSLVIPCYNEAPVLPLLTARCREIVDSHSNIEIILVDNGSTDDTPHILKKTPLESIRTEVNKGYGHSILEGLKCASGDVLGWTHADMQADPGDIIQGIRLFERYGTNTFAKGRRHGRPLSDVFFTVGMSFFETALLKTALWDINAQPNLFPRSFFQSWKNPPQDFSLDLYAYYQAKKQGLDVRRFPVSFGKRLHGTSHWNISWRAKIKFIQRTIRFSLQLKRGL